MCTIYIEESPLILISSDQTESYQQSNMRNLLVEYDGSLDSLANYANKLEQKTGDYDKIIVHAVDLEGLKKDFFKLCHKIHAAGGGVVSNSEGKLLAIYRGGYWDLPKGKTEKGETIDQTALREVQEETGVQQIDLGDFICETFHTYRNRKDKRILKWTTWYKMQSSDQQLIPQAEESIELAVWIDKADFLQKTPIYKNILYVLEQLN